MPVTIQSVGVAVENGPATFNITAFNGNHDPQVLEGLPPGDLDHQLTYDVELETIEVSKTALESTFQFVTDSTDIDTELNDPNEFQARTDYGQLPQLDLANKNIVEADRINSSEAIQTLQYDMVRYFSKEITNAIHVVDFFNNEEPVRNDVAQGAQAFENNVHNQIIAAHEQPIVNGGGHVVEVLLNVLLATQHGRTRLFNRINSATGPGPDILVPVPFVADDEIKFVVTYNTFDVNIGTGAGAQTITVPQRRILVTLKVIN